MGGQSAYVDLWRERERERKYVRSVLLTIFHSAAHEPCFQRRSKSHLIMSLLLQEFCVSFPLSFSFMTNLNLCIFRIFVIIVVISS